MGGEVRANPRVEWRRAASGGHRQVEVSNNGQAERVNGSRSQRRGAGSRRSPRPLRRGRLVSGTSSPPSHLCSPSSPFYHPLPLFYFPSSPFIIAGGEEDGETINSYFSLLTICPHCAPEKNRVFLFWKARWIFNLDDIRCCAGAPQVISWRLP